MEDPMQKAAALHTAVSGQRESLAEVLSAAMPGAPEERIRRLIDTLILLVQRPTLPPADPQIFRHVGQARSDPILREFLRRYEQAEKLLRLAEELTKKFSATEISRLADQGMTRWDAQKITLRGVIDRVMKAIASPPPAEPSSGRPRDNLAFAAAYEVLRAYAELTDYDPGLPVAKTGRGGFTPLVEKVFSILEIDGDPKAAARRAEQTWLERH
jgi:hypothetical protein